jgi:thiamine biosynthesis lipoprotein
MGSVPRHVQELSGRRLATALTASLALGLAAAADAQTTVREGRPLMGTVLQVTLVHEDEGAARMAAEACFAEGAALEAELTTYDAESATSRMNASAGSGPFKAPPALAKILANSKQLHARTRGAFDVTVGPLIALWTEVGRAGRLPSAAELGAALRRVGSDRIVLGPEGVVMLEPGMHVDFGGSSWLALGAPEDGDAWRVLLRDGHGGFAGVVSLRNASLSFSESMAGSTEIEGRRYGHVIDPRSGWPLEEPVAGVALAGDGATAEALSTALVVLGAERGLHVVAEMAGTEAMAIDASRVRHESPGFAEATDFEPVVAVAPDAS